MQGHQPVAALPSVVTQPATPATRILAELDQHQARRFVGAAHARLALAAALSAAALSGAWLGTGPQPITDAALAVGLVPSDAAREVVLIEVDAAADLPAAAARARALGASVVATISPTDAPISGSMPLPTRQDPIARTGLITDTDHIVRSWEPRVGELPSLPAAILSAANAQVPGARSRLPAGNAGVLVLDATHLDLIEDGGLDGRIAVVGPADAWTSPMVRTPEGEQALARVIARAVAAKPLYRASTLASALLGVLATLGLWGLLGLPRFRALSIGAALSLSGALGLFLCRVGWLAPVEAVLMGMAFAVAARLALALWQQRLDHERLKSAVNWKLGEQALAAPEALHVLALEPYEDLPFSVVGLQRAS